MHTLHVSDPHPSPGGKPMPLAFDAGTLYVGCWETPALLALDPQTWTVRERIELPGKPYGLVMHDGALRIVVSIGEDDDRYLYTYVPGDLFDASKRIACPDLTGSHLASDGATLYLVQQSFRRLVEIEDDAVVRREIALPTRCAGMAFDAGVCHLITADTEFEELAFATLDLDAPESGLKTLAPMHPEARGLAHDGHSWWTSYRDEDRIVSFTAS